MVRNIQKLLILFLFVTALNPLSVNAAGAAQKEGGTLSDTERDNYWFQLYASIAVGAGCIALYNYWQKIGDDTAYPTVGFLAVGGVICGTYACTIPGFKLSCKNYVSEPNEWYKDRKMAYLLTFVGAIPLLRMFGTEIVIWKMLKYPFSR
jgi:hypothetical protein